MQILQRSSHFQKTCTTFSHPPSVPHIQAPDASELIHLHNALRHANSNLDELDNDIAHIEVILDAFHRKREALHRFITEHDALLAHIRRLPGELMTKIFVLCMPNYGMSSFDPEHSPLLIG
jgi:hypothetical protein